MERLLYFITNISMIIIAIWAITPIIIDDITIDSTVARLGLISACIANLFQKKVKNSLFVVSIILIITATIIKIYFKG
jgi:hypothetical protein